MPASISEYVPQCAGRERRPFIAWGVALACASLLLGMIVAAPLLAAGGREAAALLFYKAFNLVCHQMPERSFHLLGHTLAVCSRCTGLYAGALAGIAFCPFVRDLRRAAPPPRAWLLMAALPTTLDFLLGVTGFWENTHASRSATAALLGIVSAFYIVPGMIDFSNTRWGGFLRIRAATGD